jgi:hypothetical protein
MVLTITLSFTFVENSFAQEMNPLQQWKKFADPDILTCKSGHLLLQKSNGNPACLTPQTYLKLVERGYGIHNQSLVSKNPEMMNILMNTIKSDETLMYHWHEMMKKNPSVMIQTMDNWVSQMKDNPELLKNMLSPMMNSELRANMTQTMKNHPQMENYLKMNLQWMDSVHKPMKPGMSHSDSSMNSHSICNSDKMMSMCNPNQMMDISSSNPTMDVIHHVWINSKMAKDMHTMMLEDPSHMAMMAHQMMEPMLNGIMDDVDLRDQMIILMLENEDFMNSIRHDNPDAGH